MCPSSPVVLNTCPEFTLQQLHTFRMVCHTGSYAAAAEVLLLTPPAVWEQMRALQRYYGVPLLERSGNGMQPTPEGLRLLDLTRPSIAGLETSRDVLRQQMGMRPEGIHVASTLRVFASEISHALNIFQQQNEGMRLKLSYLIDRPLLDAVLHGDIDVALTLEPGPSGRRKGLVHEIVRDVDFLLVAPLKHPLSQKKRLSISDIVNFPLVLGQEASYSRKCVQEVFHRYHLTDSMRIAVETDSDEYSTHCVRAGMGIAITVGTTDAWLYHGFHTRSLRHWFGSVRIVFVWREGVTKTPSQIELANQISENLLAS